MVLLDFYGMPGSGKSTVSHLLSQALRNKGFTVIEPSWELNNNCSPLKRKLKKAFLAILFSLKNPKSVYDVLKCSGNIGKGGRQKINQWVNVSYTLYYVSKSCGADYMVMDAGIYQAVVSLHTETEGFDCKKTLNQMIAYTQVTIVPICISVTISEVLERLKARGTSASRVDRLNDNEKEIMLMKIEKIIKLIDGQGFAVYNDFAGNAVDVIMNELKVL